MKLTIDNLQGNGPQDYTAALDGTIAPKIERVLNKPAELRFSLLALSADFVVPVAGARVMLGRANGSDVFTGYLTQAPQYEYLGWGQSGPVYRYHLVAQSDEVLLDQKALPNRAPFVNRSAGSAIRQLAQDGLPAWFDTSQVQDVDILAAYVVNPQKKFSEQAAEICLAARASYRSMGQALIVAPIGANSYRLNESDMNFSALGLQLNCACPIVNDVTIIGLNEPKAYVRDYFVGDGLSLKFYMSQKPFPQSRPALIDEEYTQTILDAATWKVSDPAAVVSLQAQTLQIAGGTGQDGQTTISFIEQIELGGAQELQHGDVSFSSSSQGILGGLYAGTICAASCLAGFQITPSEAGSSIRALITGSPTGPVVGTQLGHRYVLTTYIYSMQIYRSQEIYHSSSHPAGQGVGGTAIGADVRFVLELQDIDPSNPASLVSPGTVLFDDVISNAPGFCTYALVDAVNLHCNIAYTYARHIALAEVRSAQPGQSYATQLTGSLSDGASCVVTSSPALEFYPQYVPALNELIVVSYRGYGRAVAEVSNPSSVAQLESGWDNGVRGETRMVKSPSARTGGDCENAALAILQDAEAAAWSGSYLTWGDFLPGSARDIFPGDALQVNVPSRNAEFSATVRKVEIEFEDPSHDRGVYTIIFANDVAAPLAIQYDASTVTVPLQDMPPQLTLSQVGSYYIADITEAQIVQVTSTTVQVDVGFVPAAGQGVEVRAHDYGWSSSNDRNLLGRFNTQTFSLPRLARAQNYFLRLYDSSSPPKYSRYAAALHVSYPL
ncbi:MAG TPA: hypothetical protein VFO39_19440 [Candidatus Sulfotelmatobacter sp.]|nr:hypothetical protein [Candidatus Sulfotelmatobacter sp.]